MHRISNGVFWDVVMGALAGIVVFLCSYLKMNDAWLVCAAASERETVVCSVGEYSLALDSE